MKIYRKNPVKYNVKIPEKFGGHCLMLENSRQFLVKIRWSDNFTGKGAHIYRKKIPKNYRPFAELPRLLRSICRKIRQNLKQCTVDRKNLLEWTCKLVCYCRSARLYVFVECRWEYLSGMNLRSYVLEQGKLVWINLRSYVLELGKLVWNEPESLRVRTRKNCLDKL